MMFEGQIDRRGDRQDLPNEVLFEDEQEMLKQIHDLKKRLGTEGWSEKEPPTVTQPSFLMTNLGRMRGHFGSIDLILLILRKNI